MLKLKPVLSSISAFDADFGIEDNEHIFAPVFKFSWKGDIVRKNRLVIRDYDTGESVYEHTVISTALKHPLQRSCSTTPYNLKNGGKYIAEVYVYTEDISTAEASPASNSVIFYCFKTPVFHFTNFKSFFGEEQTAIVSTNSVNLSVYYAQENGEVLNTYKFELQDCNGTTLLASDTKRCHLSETLLTYTIGGLKESLTDKLDDLKPNSAYKIICSGETLHGFKIYAEQDFVHKPVTSGVGALVKAENVGDGNVVIHSNYKIMNARCSTDNPVYLYDENGNPYAIDLSRGDYVEFIDGFIMEKPYEIIVKGEFKPGTLLTLSNADGQIGTISLKEIKYTPVPYYCFAFTTEYGSVGYDIRTDYFNFFTDLISAEIDLSYHNGIYNIKANVFKEDSSFSAVDDNRGNTILLFHPSVSVSGDNAGNVTITDTTLTVSHNGNGTVTISE